MAFTISVLAFAVSALSMVLAWRQLGLQRDVAGGRGVLFDVIRPSRTIHQTDTTERITESYRAIVRIVGNDRHEVGIYLQRGGRLLEEGEAGYVEPPSLRHRMTCEDEPIVWKFDLDEDVANDLWCVLVWVEPFGDAIRTYGFRRRLSGASSEQVRFEQWHWYRFFRARRRFESWAAQHGPKWFQRIAGRPRRLGEWRPYRLRPLQPGQSPLNTASPGREVT